jgi:hypothetical protein
MKHWHTNDACISRISLAYWSTYRYSANTLYLYFGSNGYAGLTLFEKRVLSFSKTPRGWWVGKYLQPLGFFWGSSGRKLANLTSAGLQITCARSTNPQTGFFERLENSKVSFLPLTWDFQETVTAGEPFFSKSVLSLKESRDMESDVNTSPWKSRTR